MDFTLTDLHLLQIISGDSVVFLKRFTFVFAIKYKHK